MRFEEIKESEVERLVDWLTKQTWPYHAQVRVDANWVHENVATGNFFGPNARAFWGMASDATQVAVIRVFDLADVTPLVDLRVAEHARRQGVGTASLRWLTRFVFETLPGTERIGGYTRHDNLPMRRVFEKCGFVQEAYHRRSWRVEGAAFADSVGYAVLRSDWLSGITTPVLWQPA
jgi:RimJ/RimL family protein N-acetyltransferase